MVSKSLLSIEGVGKTFGRAHALNDINLDVGHGEFIALLGPSGCGKTTLLRTIGGFLTPDRGRIVIDGQDVSQLPPNRRPLNTVFQQYALFPHMTVGQNTAYGPRRAGVPKAEAMERAKRALELVDMAGFVGRYPRELSGGQQQRVALARAIVNRPRLLLLDEPLSALDMKLRKRMQLELKHLQNKLGITFLFVTHDQEEAMAMADRIVVMNAGRIEQVGTGPQLYKNPATRFTAEFIGEANFFDYVRTPGGIEIEGGLVSAPWGEKTSGARGVAMLRPECLLLTVADGARPKAQCRFPAVLRDRIQLGAHDMVYVEAAGKTLCIRVPAGALPSDIPEKLEVGFSASDLHLLPEAS